MVYVLGLDLGTSSLKGLLFNEKGAMVGEAAADYALSHPQSGYSEQNPNDWIDAAKTVIHQLIQAHPDMRDQLVGISFSGQMHSLVLLDEQAQVLRPAILWNDVRTTKQCQTIMEEFGENLLAITKNVALEGFTLPKILWVQEQEPAIWEQVAHILLPKDYLTLWLTGKYSMDFSDAAGTLLLDIEQNVWSDVIAKQFAIQPDLLPPLVASGEQVGVLTTALQEEFGFTKTVGVYAGGADNACAALGAGIIHEEVGMISVGTSGVVLSYERDAQQAYQGKLHLFNHALKDGFYSMGVTLAAGNSLNWFKETFAPDQSFTDLLSGIEAIEPGSKGLLFTPYIVGERTPHTDSLIRGSFIGIDTQHTLKHFGRAVLEGITFSLKDSQVVMQEVAQKDFKQMVSVGGGAKNPTWLQMQADIFNTEIVTLTTEQGPGLGAAMLAAVGSGLFPDMESCREVFVHYDKKVQPIPENVAKYQQIYTIYQKIYEQTKDITHALQKL